MKVVYKKEGKKKMYVVEDERNGGGEGDELDGKGGRKKGRKKD